MQKNLFVFLVFFLITSCATHESGISTETPYSSEPSRSRFFLYIPNNDEMENYLAMHSFLRAWDRNQVTVDDETLSALFANYLGQDSMHSLLFESFLRYTRNEQIQRRILDYVDNNNIETSFTTSLRRLYTATPIIISMEGREAIRFDYNNTEFDENIDLFNFNEVTIFDGEAGLLLFDNSWSIISVDAPERPEETMFALNFGGATNALLISFRRFSNVDEDAIFNKINTDFHNNRFNGNWIYTELPLAGIISRSGADRFIIAHGYGTDVIPTIQEAMFSSFLYNRNTRVLFEISYLMNFSPMNINYSEKDRIFNLLFFHSLFAFIINSN